MPQKPNRLPRMLENPWSAVGNPTSAFGLDLRPFKPRACGDLPDLAEYFNHCGLVGAAVNVTSCLIWQDVTFTANMTLIMVDKPQPSYNLLNVMK